LAQKRVAIPVYYGIATDLRSAIESGELRPGELIPSEAQLCETYGVSRMTVRQGLNLLSEAGYINSIPGRGSFVVHPSYERVMIEVQPTRLPDGSLPDCLMLETGPHRANSNLADVLGIDEGDDVQLIRRVLGVNGDAICFDRIYVPPDWGLSEIEDRTAPVAQLVSRLAERPFLHVKLKIRGCEAEPEAAAHLNLPKPPFAIHLEQQILNGEADPVAWALSIFDPEGYHLTGEFGPVRRRL